jgi:hypothetical protein
VYIEHGQQIWATHKRRTVTHAHGFVHHHELPKGRKSTYTCFIVSQRPNKVESKSVRLAVCGNQIDYPGRVSTPTAGITTAKLLFNSVISTPDACLAVFDLEDLYLGTPMSRYELHAHPSLSHSTINHIAIQSVIICTQMTCVGINRQRPVRPPPSRQPCL